MPPRDMRIGDIPGSAQPDSEHRRIAVSGRDKDHSESADRPHRNRESRITDSPDLLARSRIVAVARLGPQAYHLRLPIHSHDDRGAVRLAEVASARRFA